MKNEPEECDANVFAMKSNCPLNKKILTIAK
jgi:hypothetical protein